LYEIILGFDDPYLAIPFLSGQKQEPERTQRPGSISEIKNSEAGWRSRPNADKALSGFFAVP
jgi:hypothetical protein